MSATYLYGFSNGSLHPWTSVSIPCDMKTVYAWVEKFDCQTCKVPHAISISEGNWPLQDGSTVPATLYADVTEELKQEPLFVVPHDEKAWGVAKSFIQHTREGVHAPKGCSVSHLVSGVGNALSSVIGEKLVVDGPACILFNDILGGDWKFYPKRGVKSTTTENSCKQCSAVHIMTALPGRAVSGDETMEYEGNIYYDENHPQGKSILHAVIPDTYQETWDDACVVAECMQDDDIKSCWVSTIRSELAAAWEKHHTDLVIIHSAAYAIDGHDEA